MTRKKFIKRLMGRGLSRNEANLLATVLRPDGKTYDDYYKEILWRVELAGMSRRLRGYIRKALQPVGAAAKKFVDSLMTAGLIVDEWDCTPSGKIHDMAMSGCAAPQITERHPDDALDALTYNMQIMSRADHDTLHGYACGGYVSGIDLAAGSDMTAYKPCIRLDSMVIDAGPVIPDMTKKTATELADEIMEKLQPPGGGGHD